MGMDDVDGPAPEPDSPAITTEDLLPAVNAARNAYRAGLQVGMSSLEAWAIELETYKVCLRTAMGLPAS